VSVVFIGSNPGSLLFDKRGEPAVFCSAWQAEWSVAGAGACLVIADRSGWRTYGDNEHFSRHVAGDYTRYFTEATSFPWSGYLDHRTEPIAFDLDPNIGLRATCRSVSLEIRDILDRRVNRIDHFPLGARSATLSNVYIPCRFVALRVHGVEIEGVPQIQAGLKQPDSSAYLAVAEVWEFQDEHRENNRSG
jgi:hypothetical protein